MWTPQVLIGPTVEISVTTAMEAITSKSDFALTTVSSSAQAFADRVLITDGYTISANSWYWNAAG